MNKNYGCQLKLVKVLVNPKKPDLMEVEFSDFKKWFKRYLKTYFL